MTTARTWRAATWALLLAAALPAGAHEIWFAQRAGQLALVYGAGAHDLDMVKRLPKVSTVQGLDGGGQAVRAELKAQGPLVLVDAAPELAVMTAVMDNGLWTKDRAGSWHNKGRDQVPDAVVSGRYYKYGVHLVQRPAGALAPIPGLKFQLLPVGAVFPRKKGDTLVVQALFDGKPAAGATIYPDSVSDPGGGAVRTGKDGRARIRVRNGGLNVVMAEYTSAPENPAHSLMTEHVATLSFAYDPPPE